MKLRSFIQSNKGVLAFFSGMIALVHLILLTSAQIVIPASDIIYMDFLIAVFSVGSGKLAYWRWKKRYAGLRKALDEERSTGPEIPEAEDFYTGLVHDLAKSKDVEAENRSLALEKAINEINDYMTRWVHEVKIPVSVCELVLERIEESKLADELQTELERIKFLTNQALYISRASSYSENLAVQEFELEKIVKNAVKRSSALLISKNIEVILSGLNYLILSDEKWISYVLDQLLNNACKYVEPGGRIEIGAELDERSNIRLRVRDNGIGIPRKDISRVFDKSFTGSNTVNLTKSTGMGLYISKKMLERLRHKIEVLSEPGVFTEFILTFYAISAPVFEMEDIPKVTKM